MRAKVLKIKELIINKHSDITESQGFLIPHYAYT